MILVEIYIPAVDDQFDFMLDENAKIKIIIEEVIEVINSKIRNPFGENNSSFVLCSTDFKGILPQEKTLASCNIKDGSRLLLV